MAVKKLTTDQNNHWLPTTDQRPATSDHRQDCKYALFRALPQTKTFHWKRNSWKNFYLTSRIKCNHWKELTKLIQNDLATILIGWIVAEIFDLENTPKLLTGPDQHLFDIFLRNSICHNSEGIFPIDLFHGSFWISFQSSFQLWDLYCE